MYTICAGSIEANIYAVKYLFFRHVGTRLIHSLPIHTFVEREKKKPVARQILAHSGPGPGRPVGLWAVI